MPLSSPKQPKFEYIRGTLDKACETLQKRYNLRMAWVVEFLNEEVKASLDAFPLDIRASFQRIAELIQSHGLERIREPYVKHLEGPLWEMRMKGKSGIARACYVTAVGKRIVVVHVFVKKTQKTPRREILTALKRVKEVL
jgi:phage-related protein